MRHLHVVPTPGQENPRPPKRRGPSDALILSPDETRHVKAALKGMRRTFGTWAAAGAAMGVPGGTLSSAATKRGYQPSGTLVIRMAKAAGTTAEAILTGAIVKAGTCPTCGKAGTS